MKDFDPPVTPAQLAQICKRLADGTINMQGAKIVLDTLWEQGKIARTQSTNERHL